ncbi:MAG: hypothetical protein Q9220_003749 [cf. Caloplaca sp. 1 TL-2023]
MQLPSWQEKAIDASSSDRPPVRIPFNDAKKFFAVDASGSTSGAIMRAQAKTVNALHGNGNDHVVLWESVCQTPRQLDSVPQNYFNGCGGTYPSCILKQPSAVDQIHQSDLWVLLTDGEVSSYAVSDLDSNAQIVNVLQVPIILVITGSCVVKPEMSNISVGVSFFASAREALILFKDYQSGKLFVIDAKGSFAALKPDDLDLTSSWEALPRFADEASFVKRCKKLKIDLIASGKRSDTRAVSLGAEWDNVTGHALVNVAALLEQPMLEVPDLRNILQEQAFSQLALLCKIRGKLGTLRDLIVRHKTQEYIVRLEDRHGAGKIMQMIQAADPNASQSKERLVEELRTAHMANREIYFRLRNEVSEEQRLASEMNRLIDRGLQTIAGLEKSGYTADILNRKSNRAMRASVVSAAESRIHVAALDLSEEVPAFRSSCPICCDESQIMSVTLRRLATVEENTTDFALNFPLAAAQAKQNADMISAQCICFQCALVLEKSIYQEDIIAIIPTLDYEGANKKYIDHQLTLAVTAGLATGASGIVQLFMTILDRTLEGKEWCSPHTQDMEIQGRRQVLEWTLQNLLQRCKCREDFCETGHWVDYPKAIQWAVDEYKTAGLDSWIVRYPLAGFSQFLRWLEILQLPIPTQTIEAMKQTKLMHQVATVMMNQLLHSKPDDRSWTYPFMELIYREFNAPGVPRDLGRQSILRDENYWFKLEAALGDWQDVKRFLALFDATTRQATASRIQIIAFWIMFSKKGHTTPKTFFANVTTRKSSAPAVLDPTAALSLDLLDKALLSIFLDKSQLKVKVANGSQNVHMGKAMPPFASPFGASVLHCGFPGCDVEFFHQDDLKDGLEVAGHLIRARRAKHLAEVFGVSGIFNSQTGLPDPTQAPKAPTCYHNSMHISIARSWNRQSPDSKRAIISAAQDSDSGTDSTGIIDSFIAKVRHELCANSHRGNIYSASIDDEVRTMLPSFLEALGVASKKLGLENDSGVDYVYDWTANTIVMKMKYELGIQ